MAEPLIVQTAKGPYSIPIGAAPGTWAFAREASLIAVAYQQLGDDASALKWQREYTKRQMIYQQAEAGRDLQAIIDELGDPLLAPLQIIYDVVSGIVRTVERGAGAGIRVVEWLPWLVLAGIGAISLGLFKGTLRGRLSR